MTHSIFGNRFYSNREPAWHGLGIVTEEPLTAQDAFTAAGPYDVHLEPMKTLTGIDTDYNAIVRDPTPDFPEAEVFGAVKGKYTLVTPQRFCEIWDEATGIKLETLGALNGGKQLFMCTKMQPFTVAGRDEVVPYLLAVNDMTGGAANEVRQTPVRTVCQNTLQMARAQSTEVFRIPHDKSVEKKLAEWLQGLAVRAEQRRELAIENFELFARTPLASSQVQYVVNTVYPMPDRVALNAPDYVIEQRMEVREKVAESVAEYRRSVMELFEGKMVGYDQLTGGTAWALYNAVTELENYRKGPAGSRGENILFGTRGKRMETAFAELLEIAQLEG